MKYLFVLIHTILCFSFLNAQHSYKDSILAYQENYVKKHEVIKGNDRQYLYFFPPDETYRVLARFEKIYDASWFKMSTSANEYQVHRIYGILHFSIHDTLLALPVYQSQSLMKTKQYADYLFVPFTDKSCGEESYESGRYIDLLIKDVESGSCILDFNKSYNPYCAYVTGRYSCPIPPRENDLPVAIHAGEMRFGKSH